MIYPPGLTGNPQFSESHIATATKDVCVGFGAGTTRQVNVTLCEHLAGSLAAWSKFAGFALTHR
jgi:hypothetical protein